jgi:class 3 adenylate cyclase/tetratricopeptide (TPR) repeat protein
MATCRQCGAENREEARFCDSCGAPLVVEPEAPREERKVVTVLFADLVGFTARAEQMDPEDVRALVTPYYAHVKDELERHGGTVEKFIGDAVMALFGAPTAHEDDPERAVRAALAIRDWVRDEGDLQLRIGITTGEALVALGARPGEGEAMASGDVVNTAARLQSAAPADGILVDETTYRATAPQIAHEPRGEIEAKGKARLVPVWEAIEATSRFGVDVGRPGGGPLVGREKELDLLVDALARARQEQAPQLVTLVGVPGIGKSRLVAELFGVVAADPDFIHWRQGRCLPYGDGVTYWALGEMVKAHAGILESDSEEEATRKLEASAGEDAWVVGPLRLLVGLADDKPQSAAQPEAFAAWRRFFEAIGERGPLVLVFEDLHWADDSLLEFIDHLVDWATGIPLLVVCTTRPELLSRRPGWGGGKPNAVTISLSPLSDDETARLVHALLDRSVLPADVQSALIERAGGNPLYAEEFVRMVEEVGAQARGGIDALPESVQGIIAARLDALPLDEKLLLQDAAVAGKVFWLDALEHIGGTDGAAAEQILHALERKEFVRRERRSAVGDEGQYAFRHLLVRDVAYSQIPRAARAQKHRAAAEWIESLGRPDDHAEMIAHHYLGALEFAGVADEELPGIADRARVALRAAGSRNLALNSWRSASRFYRSALELWPRDDPERPYVLLEHGKALWEGGHVGEDALNEASAALAELRDPTAAAEAEILLADISWRRGNSAEAVRRQERAAELIADAEASPSTVLVLNQLSRFRMLASAPDDAIPPGERALSMAREMDDVHQEIRALITLGTARCNRGERRGLEEIERAIALAQDIETTELIRALNNKAQVLEHLEGFGAMEAPVEEMNAVAERLGYPEWLRWARDKRASLRYHTGRWDESETLLDDLIVDVEAGSIHYLAGSWFMLRSRIRHAKGEVSTAVEQAQTGLKLAREAGDDQMVGPNVAWNARIAARPEARALFDEMLEIWGRSGPILGPPTGIPDMAVTAVTLGREDAFAAALRSSRGGRPWVEAGLAYVSGEFSDAADRYAVIGALPMEADARLRAAQALVAGGRRAEADREVDRALAFWRSVGATAYVREGEALLAAAG